MLSRRELLGRSRWLLLLALVGWQFWGRRPLPARLGATGGGGPGGVALPPSCLVTLAAFAGAALDDDEGGRWVATEIDRYLGTVPQEQAAELALALRLVEHTPGPWFDPRRFSRRSLRERQDVMERWARSGLGVRRQISLALRKAARFTWFAQEKTWGELGYEGTWLGRAP